MLHLLLLSFLGMVQSTDDNTMQIAVALGGASSSGFSFSYKMTNPDLDDPPGKIYWVLTDDATSMTTADVMAGNNPTSAGCLGQVTQTDSEIHQDYMNCPLTPGTPYRFWVLADFNGDGTQATFGDSSGTQVIPEEDQDCTGVWSSCDAQCIQTYTIQQYPTGNGAGCTTADEETQTCSPGTDDCPVAGTYTVANPSPEGFDITLDPDDTVNTAGGQWYYMVTPTGATPTADEVKAGSGGLCGAGPLPITTINAQTEYAACALGPDTYDVWVAEDPQGNDAPQLLSPLQQVTIPAPTPSAHIYAHSPTDTGLQLSYDIDNPDPNGLFYYYVVPAGTSVTASQIRSATSCAGSVPQTVPSPLKTLSIDCALTPDTQYDVWGEVDTDGAGTNAALANSGTAFSFVYHGDNTHTVITTTTTTAAPTQPGETTTTVATTSGAGATATYRLLFPGEQCEGDQIGDGLHVYDLIVLRNVKLGIGSDVAQCAAQVAANRAANGGCSTLFDTGGFTGGCRCVRLGYVCDRDESEIGRSIFKLCLSSENCHNSVIYFPDLMLEESHHVQKMEVDDDPSSTPYSFMGVHAVYLFLSVLVGVLLGVCAYRLYTPRKILEGQEFHIALDQATL